MHNQSRQPFWTYFVPKFKILEVFVDYKVIKCYCYKLLRFITKFVVYDVLIFLMCTTLLWWLCTFVKFGNNNNKHCHCKRFMLIIVLCAFTIIDKYWRKKYVFMNEFQNTSQQQNILRFWKRHVNLALKTKKYC